MTPTILYMLWLLLWRSVVPMFVLSGRVLSWIACLCAPVLWAAWFLGFVAACAMSAEAGWFPWQASTPPKPDTSHLERAAEVARDAARVASQAVESQAKQASSQAEQNARVAELLGRLSAERESLAVRIESLAEARREDSEWAAALNASGPVVVCVAGLCVACLALWLVSRPGSQLEPELAPEQLATAMEVLFQEAGFERLQGPLAAHGGLPGHLGSPRRLTASDSWHVAANSGPGNALAEEAADDQDPESFAGQDLEPAGEQMPF